MTYCPICQKEILETELRFQIPFEEPYCNLMVHREHFKECGNLSLFYIKYGEICYNYITQINKTKENKKK
jgi:hypothetical protein